MATVNINSQSYEVDMEVFEQFGKFIQREKTIRQLKNQIEKINNGELIMVTPDVQRLLKLVDGL